MKKLMTILAAAALLAACSKEEPGWLDAPEGCGVLVLSAGSSSCLASVSRADQVELSTLGVTPPTAEQIKSWNTYVTNTQYDAAAPDLHPNGLTLAVAEYAASNKHYLHGGESYQIKITDPAKHYDVMDSPEGADKPYFEGRSAGPVTVVARQKTSVNVTVALANSVVRIRFTERFKNYFPNGARFTLKTAAGTEFETGYTADDHSVAETPWFVRPAAFTIEGTATKQRPSATVEPETVSFSATTRGDVAPRTLYTYTFDVSGVGAAGTITVTINGDPVEIVPVDQELNENA